jgi:hypothetical protein
MARPQIVNKEERARSRLFQRVREELKADQAGAVQALNKGTCIHSNPPYTTNSCSTAIGDLVTISPGSNQLQRSDPPKYGALRIAKYVCIEPKETSDSLVDGNHSVEEEVAVKPKETSVQSTHVTVEEQSSDALALSVNAQGDGQEIQITSESQKAPINLSAYLQYQLERLEHARRTIDEQYRK